MDKKSFIKGLFTGLGVALASLVITGGVIACNQKGTTQPVTTTPIVNNFDNRGDYKSFVRKAPDLVDSENLFDKEGYFISSPNCVINFVYPSIQLKFGGAPSSESMFVSRFLPAGLYYFEPSNNGSYFAMRDIGNVYTRDYFVDELSHVDLYNPVSVAVSPEDYQTYFYPFVKFSSGYFYSAGDTYVLCRGIEGRGKLYLVDTLDAPAQNVVSFPNNWSPLQLVTDDVSVNHGYGILKLSSPTYGTLVPFSVELNELVFRYDGKVYNQILFLYEDLSHGLGYIQDDGVPWKPWEKTPAELNVDKHVIGLSGVAFKNTYSNTSVTVLSPVMSSTAYETGDTTGVYPPIVYLPTGEYRWNSNNTTIEIIDDSTGVDSQLYQGRFSGYSDLDILLYLRGYTSTGNLPISGDGAYLGGGSYDPFILITLALQTTTTFMSFSVLPGLTIGMLMIVPLIVTLIVIVFKVVKK